MLILFIIVCLVVIVSCILYFLDKNKKIESKNVGKVSLYLETYRSGKNQPTHPDIIKFNDEWNGYKYWMSYTPYPYADGEEENPSIAVSNDLYKWTTPKGLANPIANNEEVGCDELKDSILLYRKDLDRLEVWYLGRLCENLGGDGKTLTLFRKTSTDGSNWSKFEVMCDFVGYTSPSIIWIEEKYLCWAIKPNIDGRDSELHYLESKDGCLWENKKVCTIGESMINDIWHGSVKYNDNGYYEFVYIPSASNSQNIYYTKSKDGITFDKKQSIIENGKSWSRFYRPTILYNNDFYSVIYGVITKENKWLISMSKGDNILNLEGINDTDIVKMNGMPVETMINKKQYYKQKVSNYKKSFYRLELVVFIPLLYILQIILYKIDRFSYRNIMDFILVLSFIISEGFILRRFKYLNRKDLMIGFFMAIVQCIIMASSSIGLIYIFSKG